MLSYNMVFDIILRGAYGLARTTQENGMLRGDAFMILGGLIGATTLFYGSRLLPKRMVIVDDDPLSYVTPQIRVLREQMIQMRPFM
ncbi:MAG: hypothetical protein ABID54_11865 [Pseudomonadota bacterium]